MKIKYVPLTITVFLASSPSHADPSLITSGGILMGAKDVTVNGSLYNVAFESGTYNSIFSNTSQANLLSQVSAVTNPDGLWCRGGQDA